MKMKRPDFLIFLLFLIPFFVDAQVHLVTSGFNAAGGDAVGNQSFDFSFGEAIAQPIETNNVKGNIGILQFIPDDIIGVDVENFSQLSVSPNPSLGVFEILSSKEENYNFKIYATDGSLRDEGKHIGNRNTIDISEYAPGVYLLSLSNDNKMQNFKLLKL